VDRVIIRVGNRRRGLIRRGRGKSSRRGRSGCETVQLDSGGSGRRNRGAIVFLIFFSGAVGRNREKRKRVGGWGGAAREWAGHQGGPGDKRDRDSRGNMRNSQKRLTFLGGRMAIADLGVMEIWW
jgi:hypothetical protein